MVKKADIGGKRLISLAPTAWVQWVTQQPDAVAQEILGSEFQWVGRNHYWHFLLALCWRARQCGKS